MSRRKVACLLGAHGISMLGTSMSFLAIPWFVLAVTGSATTTGLAAFSEMLPYVLAQGLGGPLVDRLGSRRISVATDLAAAAAMGFVPAAHAAHLLPLPALLAAVALAGASSLPVDRASGLHDGLGRLAGLLGGPLAGVLIALSSAPAVLAFDAATFLASAVLVGSLTGRSRTPSGGQGSYLAHLREGYRHLQGDRLLVGIAAMILVTNLLDQAYAAVLLPVWVRRELGSPVALGTLSACFGAGAVAGNGLMAWLGPRLPRRLPFALSFLVCGAPRFFPIAFAARLSPVLAVAFASGLGAGGLNPALSAVEYERVPAHLQARVLGTLNALAWAGIPLGGLAGGALADAFGLRAALCLCGGAYFLATLAPFLFPVWRQMERPALRLARDGAEWNPGA
jgi:hypothetical protein